MIKHSAVSLKTKHVLIFAVIIVVNVIFLVLGAVNSSYFSSLKTSKLKYTADNATATFDASLKLHEMTLTGIKSFMNSAGQPSRQKFSEYITNLKLAKNLPSVSVVGYLELIEPTERQRLITEVTNDTTFFPNGYPNFTIEPDPQANYHLVIKYIEPYALSSSIAAMGNDFAAEPARLAAFEQARDLNQAIMTSPVISFGSNLESFILVMPVYDQSLPRTTPEERQAAVTGAVNLVFRRAEFFNQVFSPYLEEDDSLRIQVYDGTQADHANLLYDSDQDSAVLGDSTQILSRSEIRTIANAGRDWTFVYSKPMDARSFPLPFIILAFFSGVIIVFAIYGLVNAQRSFDLK